MAQPLNRYKADLRDFRFLLFEQLQIQDMLGKEPFADWGPEEISMVLDEVYRYATEVSGPLNQIGDLQGCKLENGQVKTPDGFANAWKKIWEAGWRTLGASPRQVLTAATAGGARVLGLDDVGHLRPGARADFVLYRGDVERGPFDAARVRAVGKDGVLFVRDGAWTGR